jgi:thioredoxin reductase (NADPH)
MDELAAFPTLSPRQLEDVATFGERRRVEVGDRLIEAGAEHYDFSAVVSGRVRVTARFDDEEQELADYGPGGFVGELSLLTGQRPFVTATVVEAGEVVSVTVPELRRMIGTLGPTSDVILGALVARRSLLLSGAARSVRVIGSRFSAESLALREFLARNRIPHETLDIEEHADVDRFVAEFGITADQLPVVIAGTAVLRRATPGAVAQHLGLTIESIPERCFDLIVVGSGPAGLAAAVYGASEGLRTIVVEAVAPGGQAGTSSRIENYLGFPAGISGSELTNLAVTQALKFGARFSTPCTVDSLGEQAGHLVVRLDDGTEIGGRAVVAATGAHYRRLPVERLADYEGTGVYYAATDVEARLAGDAPAVVVGGGNSAGQAALFLAGTCSSVALVIRGPDVRRSMSSYLVDRIEAHPTITVRTGTEVSALHGERTLAAVTLAHDDGEAQVDAHALFSFIGAVPASDWLSGCAAVDARGFVRTDRDLESGDLGDQWTALGRDPLPFEASHPGLFAVGDLRSGSMKRVASSVGEGSAAVRSIHSHLSFGS